MLISHERLGALTEILQEYHAEMNRRLSISDAEIVTARPLEEQERAKLEGQVAELAGTRVSIVGVGPGRDENVIRHTLL